MSTEIMAQCQNPPQSTLALVIYCSAVIALAVIPLLMLRFGNFEIPSKSGTETRDL